MTTRAARELCPADRIVVGSKTFVVIKLPEFTNDDDVILYLVDPITKIGGTFGCHWRAPLRMEVNTSEHPSYEPSAPPYDAEKET